MSIVLWSIASIYGVSLLACGALGTAALYSPRVRAQFF